jgi:PAS domain S-box-containing protein
MDFGNDVLAWIGHAAGGTASDCDWLALFENIDLLVTICDRDGRFTFVNGNMLRATGFRADELLGQAFTQLVAPQSAETALTEFRETISGRRHATTHQITITCSNGEERALEWSSGLLRGPYGRIGGIVCISRDITPRVRADAAREHALQNIAEALERVETIRGRLENEVVSLRNVRSASAFEGLIGDSDVLKFALHHVEQVAPLDTTVLIYGETGVGKELFARAIHTRSPRRNQPLVTVNCAALPASLIESEFFGHERGAFTNAIRTRKGRFELADGGTLFLDEIGELPLEVQGKLLRVIEEGELERVGDERTIKVNVRVVAATHRQLRAEVAEGRFRPDLYYRLSVYPITVPPLRQRPTDIPLLARAFTQRLAQQFGRPIDTIPQPVIEELVRYDWPGNVRELENVIEQAVITSPERTLRLASRLIPAKGTASGRLDRYQGTLEEVERTYTLHVLEEAKWRIEGRKGAATLLGLHPNTLRARMRKLGIARP